jgi:hypothetical protein
MLLLRTPIQVEDHPIAGDSDIADHDPIARFHRGPEFPQGAGVVRSNRIHRSVGVQHDSVGSLGQRAPGKSLLRVHDAT